MIRKATTIDVPRILDLGEQMHAESPRYGRLTFSRLAAEAQIKALIGGHGVVLVAEVDGAIVGGIMCVMGPHWASLDYVATELCLFVLPMHRVGSVGLKLVSAFRQWAYDEGAVMAVAGVSTGINHEGCAKLYERAGFNRSSIGLELHFGS